MVAARILTFPKPSHLQVALATVDAALAVIEGDDRTRWAEALRRFRNFMFWRRAAVITEEAWQLTSDDAPLEPVGPRDPAVRLAARTDTDGIRWMDARSEPLPEGVRGALIARRRGVALYFEIGFDRPAPEDAEQRLVLLVLHFMAALGSGAPEPSAPCAGLVGESSAMRAVFDRVARFADSQYAVHIFGETGTGKERIATALHSGSPRSRGPFVPVNCAAIPEEMFESELFGHARGAFTGAASDRDGFVAAAHGGTLFLDEIPDLSLRGQAKLLRFLENGEYRRVGETQLRKADVRLVTASNVPLETRVASGAFRDDVLRRIKVLYLHLPPLRDRHRDIALLGRHLLRDAAERERKPMPRLSETAWRALERYRWPGNVRELKAEMQRLVVERAGAFVRAHDLAREITQAHPRSVALRLAIDDFERQHIRATLAECRGTRSEAARRLGLTRQGLRSKMKRLGIA
jgi:two-component system response regulator HydG